jgi:hypothetical protein
MENLLEHLGIITNISDEADVEIYIACESEQNHHACRIIHRPNQTLYV